MSRKISRDMAMKLAYQMEISKDFSIENVEAFIAENENENAEAEFIRDIGIKLVDNKETLDSLISKYSKGWSIVRISKIDLSILRVAIAEMLYRKDISKSISINEAVELAKTYGGENSPAFVNGVLGSVANEIEE
ncbi:MAG: transcription antitermination factor NusB [Peptoclostridium sp.]|uniref:transcription antitermination factor NusB n=1 Tax=Peptoclostridium sp. TaxID=1904860 RepID=UPI00139DCE52|nr:transcription antitermination factor NusB [Peptoclostridium sp.]MZQ75984.1 transcription antitermination factor NusB [Peptoclostridium sp.]